VQIPTAFRSLRDQALHYLPLGSTIDSDNNVLIGHAPQVGPEAYFLTLFAPAQEAWFENFKQNESKEIPTLYRAMLSITNGYSCFDLSLFGLAPSMQESLPLLDRSKRQCHDLSLANRDWIHEFEVEENSFYFGCRALNASEKVGYFLIEDCLVLASRSSGETVGKWSNFSLFLDEELACAEVFAKSPASIWRLNDSIGGAK
jgi:hypothetical protein